MTAPLDSGRSDVVIGCALLLVVGAAIALGVLSSVWIGFRLVQHLNGGL